MKTALSLKKLCGFSLVETMVAAAICSVVLGLAMSSSVMMQRSMLATDFISAAHNDQLRLSDYLSQDLRPATSVTLSRNGAQIDLTLPAENAPLLQTNVRIPVLGTMLKLASAKPERAVRYTQQGSEIYREEAGKRVLIASNLSVFQAVQNGGTIQIKTSFAPQYSAGRGTASTEFTALTQTIFLH